MSAAREDALDARLLVLLLGVPGLVLSAVVTGLVLSPRNDRQRRDLALLRLRVSPTVVARILMTQNQTATFGTLFSSCRVLVDLGVVVVMAGRSRPQPERLLTASRGRVGLAGCRGRGRVRPGPSALV